MRWVRVGSASAIGRGDVKQDELLVGEEEAIPGVGDRVTVGVTSGTEDVMVRLYNGTMQTGGTIEWGEGAGHSVIVDWGAEGVAFVKGKIFSSKVTWWER